MKTQSSLISLKEAQANFESVQVKLESSSKTYKNYIQLEEKLKNQIRNLKKSEKKTLITLDKYLQKMNTKNEEYKFQIKNFPETNLLEEQIGILEGFIKNQEAKEQEIFKEKLISAEIINESENVEDIKEIVDKLIRNIKRMRRINDFRNTFDTEETKENILRKISLLKDSEKKLEINKATIKEEKLHIMHLKKLIACYKNNT